MASITPCDSRPDVFDGDGRRVLAVMGTRPEVIKLAPLIEAMRASGSFAVTLCAVAQQTDLLRDALDDWQLTPDLEIPVTRSAEGLTAVLAEIVSAMAAVIRRLQPNLLVVQGDTISAMGAALAAGYERVPISHVEAGLRTGDQRQPFPEELQRVVIDRLSAIRYAPTEQARANLLAEGCDPDSVVVVGNTVVDALRMVQARRLTSVCGLNGDADASRRVLVTAHRRENFGDGMASICRAIRLLVELREDVDIVYVLHSNPHARTHALATLDGLPRVRLVEPLGYPAFIQLMEEADVVVTDSGGVQEEAPYLGKPVVVTREVTERPEGAEQGHATLVGTDPEAIVAVVTELLDAERTPPASAADLYGDGRASERICADLLARMSVRSDVR